MKSNKSYTERCHKDFGEFIKRNRLMRGLLQQEVAELIGVSQPYYSRIEQGKRDVDFALALKICDCLKIDISEFTSKYHY